MSKYKNKKVIVDGMKFDSRKEYSRFLDLELLEKAGKIQDLQRQVKYILIPEQREYTTEYYKKGKKKGLAKPGKLLEKECSYYADFNYYESGKFIVEDVKGHRTKEYIIKRKLMLWKHGIRIKEV